MQKLLSVIFILWFCSLATQSLLAKTPVPDRTLRVVLGEAPTAFNVLTAELAVSKSFLKLLFLPVWVNEGNPWQLVERWEVSEDGKRYTFYLREDLLWKDGSVVEAADLAASMAYQLSGEDTQVSRSYYKQVARDMSPETGVYHPRIKVLSKHSLELEMRNPDPVFMDRLSVAVTTALKANQLTEKKAGWDTLQNIQTLSPYRVVENNLPASLVLEKFPEFPGAKELYWERIEFSFIPQLEKRMSAMKQGNFDIALVLELNNDVGDNDALPGRLALQEVPNSRFIVLNPQNKLLQNPMLREAFYWLADPSILTSSEYKLEKPLFTLVPDGLDPDYRVVNPLLPGRKQRFARAQQLLDQLGISPENPIKLRFRVLNSRSCKTPARRLVEIAGRYGVLLDMVVAESSAHYGGFFGGDYDLTTIEWFGRTPVASAQMLPFGLGSSLHKQGYNSQAYLSGMGKVGTAVNKKELYEAIAEVDKVVVGDRYVLPISSFYNGLLLGPRVDLLADTLPRLLWMLKPADQSSK